MKKVYLLEHTYTLWDINETKTIWIYSSNELALKAIKRLKNKKWFIDNNNNNN